MYENMHLFNAQNENGESLSLYHTAEMVAILGPPSLNYLRRTKTSLKYFDDAGNWIDAANTPDISHQKISKEKTKVLSLKF